MGDAVDSTLNAAGNAAEGVAQPATDALEKTKEVDHVMDSDIVQQGFPLLVNSTLAAGAGGAFGGGEAGFAGEASPGMGDPAGSAATTSSGAGSTSGSFTAGAGGPSGLDAPIDSGFPGDPAGQQSGGGGGLDAPGGGTAAATPLDAAPAPVPTDATTPTDPTAPAPVPTDGTPPVDPAPVDAPAPAPAVLDSATTGGEMFSGSSGGSGFGPAAQGFGDEASLGAAQGFGDDPLLQEGSAGFAGEGSPGMGDPAGTTAPGGGIGSIDTAKVEKALGMAGKYGPLGLGAYGMYAQKQAQNKAAEAAKRAGAPDSLAGVGDTQRQVGKDLVGQAQSGNINASDKTNIDNWESNAVAQSRAYYAKAGLSDSSMATNAEADIKSRATAMREQARQNLLQQGLDALNVTDKFTADAIRANMAGDQAAAKQATDFLNSYGQWLRTLPALTGKSA